MFFLVKKGTKLSKVKMANPTKGNDCGGCDHCGLVGNNSAYWKSSVEFAKVEF